jgi:hypothetical protein
MQRQAFSEPARTSEEANRRNRAPVTTATLIECWVARRALLARHGHEHGGILDRIGLRGFRAIASFFSRNPFPRRAIVPACNLPSSSVKPHL